MKNILILLVFLIMILSIKTVVSGQIDWQNICPDPSNHYCKNVGKIAYNATGPLSMRDIKLGKIIGVAWRPEGSLIGYSPAIPKAGISEEIRLSPRNAFYYIIDDEWGKPFLRQCREINAK